MFDATAKPSGKSHVLSQGRCSTTDTESASTIKKDGIQIQGRRRGNGPGTFNKLPVERRLSKSAGITTADSSSRFRHVYPSREREEGKKWPNVKTKRLSPLEYQGHTDRSGSVFIRRLRESRHHHSHRSESLLASSDTSIAFFERFKREFRFLLDLDFIFRHEHGHDRYPFSFEEPENQS